MGWLERLLGSDGGGGGGSAVSEGVREIASRLDAMDPERAQFLAAFASVLARVADADLKIDHQEKAAMGERIAALARLDPGQAELIVELAARRMTDHGGSDRYLSTRDFRRLSTRDERIHLVECLFAVAAADGSISTAESSEAITIAEELGLTRQEALGLRSAWRDHLAELQRLPG